MRRTVVRAMAPPGTVTMLGFDENEKEDLLQQHLQAAAETRGRLLLQLMHSWMPCLRKSNSGWISGAGESSHLSTAAADMARIPSADHSV